jgi:hypothetical protein
VFSCEVQTELLNIFRMNLTWSEGSRSCNAVKYGRGQPRITVLARAIIYLRASRASKYILYIKIKLSLRLINHHHVKMGGELDV